MPEDNIQNREDKPGIDCHIATTKAELKKGIFNTDIIERHIANPPRDEFIGSNAGLQILRRYLWLILKLSVLYIAKGVMLFIPRNKPVEPKA